MRENDVRKLLGLSLAFGLMGILPAAAACPAQVTGNSAEAIRANSARLLCLQRDAADLFEQRKREFDMMSLGQRIDAIELQQRFDALPRIQPYVPPN